MFESEKKLKVTNVEGGMKKNWLSNLARSPKVTDSVKAEASKVKQSMEAKIKIGRSRSYKWHYGSRALAGKWGTTVLIWPTTPAARREQQVGRAAASASIFRPKSTTSTPSQN